MARPYLISIACEKGGVGKTTLATNLAIYLKGLAEDLPVTLLSFDNHFTVDRMLQLGKQRSAGTVADLFRGADPAELVMDGQYGVQYIASSQNLYQTQQEVSGVAHLAQILSCSALDGVVIVDTSPILDIYTRNAIFAADRVIVPVKDAPSLENCRNLTRFLSEQKLSRSVLRLLPCLIDTRIHFDGPFRNAYQLLKAFAINRGHKCYEGYIAKSPKVESLATNPEGKIYPILTHGRNTEVHLQFMHLTRQVYLDYLDQGPTRMEDVARDLSSQQLRHKQEREERLARLQPGCLCCGRPAPEAGVWPGAYYLESADGQLAGFVEEGCFVNLLLKDCYGDQRDEGLDNGLRDLLVEAAGRSYILLQRTPLEGYRSQVDFYRLDEHGERLSGRSLLLQEEGFFRPQGEQLLQLFRRAGAQPSSRQLLLAHRTGAEPQTILEHQPYLQWQTVLSRVLVDQREELKSAENSELPQVQ